MAKLLRLVALSLLLAFSASAQDKKEVDLALALAIDISGSIDPDEAKLQREGYVQAFRDPVIKKAILGGSHGRIAVAYYEWSDAWVQRLLIDWTLLDLEAAIDAFTTRLANAPISIARRTSISGAIRYAIPLFGRSPYEAERKVLDISGDGSNNDGGLVTDMRYEALKERIVINGLPIMNDRPNPFGFPSEADLDKYYLHCVTGGPRSFVEVATNFEDFPRAVRKKLLQEVADLGPDRGGRVTTSTSACGPCPTARSSRKAGGGRCAARTTTPPSCGRNTSWAATSASGAAASSGSAASGSRRTDPPLRHGPVTLRATRPSGRQSVERTEVYGRTREHTRRRRAHELPPACEAAALVRCAEKAAHRPFARAPRRPRRGEQHHAEHTASSLEERLPIG